MRAFERLQPSSWTHAVELLDAARRTGIAAEAKGAGTDLVDRLKEGTAAPTRVVDLRRLPGGATIERTSSGVRIGALTTLAVVARELAGDFPALAAACGGAATPQVRNAATLAGNLCQRPRCWYFRSAEFECLKKGGGECLAQEGENSFHALYANRTCAAIHPSAAGVALLALGADIETISPKGARTIPVAGFFARPEDDIGRENVLGPAELITSLTLRKIPAARSAYRKLMQKQSFDWPLADAAVAWQEDDGIARDVRVVLGSCAPVPFRALAAERALEGTRPDAASAARAAEAATGDATPLAQNGWRLPLVKAAARRAILGAAGLPDGTDGMP